MNIFQKVKVKGLKYNSFDLSHERKLTLNMGDLVPILLMDIVPGDRFAVSSEVLLRLSQMLAPIMHRVNVYTHFFFVPNRLVWSNWEKFITGGEDGLQTAVMPKMSLDYANRLLFQKGSLADYFGVPVNSGTVNVALEISALPFRAYQMIYNEYYRDQNLTTKLAFGTGDTVSAGDHTTLMTMRKRAWEKDYFTSSLPFAQRGGAVEIPGNANVIYKDTSDVKTTAGLAMGAGEAGVNASGQFVGEYSGSQPTGRIENIDDITTETLVNDLRVAVRLQEWLEKNARAGSRYIEQIWSNFKILSSDARLQRPEYLGGGKQSVTVSEVLSTNQSADVDGGEMFGHGISVGKTNRFKRQFEEHGYVIGIMSVLPRTSYQQGIEKHWLKDDKLDFFWPDFAQLGEQEVNKQELYVDYLTSSDALFGYQMRYAEYKYKQSSVHGDFRDDLDYWHLGRIFSGVPTLNTSFVESDPSHRIFAVTDPGEHKLYCYVYNSVKALRNMPYFNSPTL